MTKATVTTQQLKTILLSSFGGCLEFYDFIIFGVFASTIGHTFFPSTNKLVSLMSAFAAFAAGYLARPLGGIIFSHFGDRYGRKPTFMLTILIMAVSTCAIGLLPGYQTLGITAMILFVLLRIIQGSAIGGEIPGAATFMSEHCTQHRGLACGLLILFINSGILLADIIHSVLNKLLVPQYAWRTAFIIGGTLAIISYMIRKNLHESPAFKQLKNTAKTPLFELVKNYKSALASGSSIIMLQALGVSIFYVYIVSYMQLTPHHSELQISRLTITNVLIMTISCGFWGWISDYLPPKRLLYISTIAIPAFGAWFYHTLNTNSHTMLAYSILSIFFGMYAGSTLGWITSLFPARVRFSGVALCYNLSFAIFGGLSPLVATYLIKIYHNTMLPAWIVVILAPLTLIGCLISRANNTST